MDATMEAMEGTYLKGYQLEDRIGSGGYGAVYRAWQTTLGREVAVKIILPGFASDPDFIRRFETEAGLIARLEHPHITPLYDFWRDPQGAYLVMRYLRGGSLRQTLEISPYELEAASQLLDQIAAALDYAHRQDVIHRDFKPGNILLDEDGNAYLADFGIAKNLTGWDDQKTAVEAILGSLTYVAPEQLRGEPVTSLADIYSLGVTLYEIITGEHPFPAVTTIERLYKHINDPVPQINTLSNGRQEAVNEVIQKATAKDPGLRYQDPLALAVAFRQAIGKKPADPGVAVVEQLTMREQEILSMIAQGMSNRQIADELVVTVGTVKWHITQLYKKLGARSRVQAIVRARELDLIVGDDLLESLPGAVGPQTATLLPEPENPYKGLRPFQVTDARIFFGRDELVDKLTERMSENDPYFRFLAVIGPSGSGKSSLVRAGLIASLWRGAIPGSQKWFVVDMTPGAHPLDKLETALIRVAANQACSLRQQLQRDERGLLRVADLILPADETELVVVVDQFEELFTLVEEEAARERFLDLLRAAVSDVRSRVRVVITLRADYYDRPLHYPDFGELVRSRMETVLPLSARGLERAIRGPAERAGVTFEQGLVEQMVSQMNYQAGALPLLQYALTELFDRRDGRLLTYEACQKIGGAVGALANRAEEIYGGLSEEAREMARQMFLRLVTLGEGTGDARRRATMTELLSLTENDDLMEEVIEQFAAYRLLSLDHDPETRQPTVEVAHEAILREWVRLREWLNDSRDDIRQERVVGRAAGEWEASERETSYLLRGARLEQVETWAQITELTLTPLEDAYIAESLAQHEREEIAELARQVREEQLEQRSRAFLRGLVVVFALAAIISGALGLFALQQRGDALASAAEAQNVALVAGSQAALANNDTDAALALAWQALELDPDSTLAQAQLSAAAYTPGTVRQFLGHADMVDSVDISPDQKTILSSSWDHSLILWDLETGEALRKFEGHAEPVYSIDISDDGQTAVSAGEGTVAILWDMQTGGMKHRFEGYKGPINEVRFSPDGKSIAAAGWDEDWPVIRWDIETGEIIGRYEGEATGMQGLEFTPDGSGILSGSNDGLLFLWDAQTGEILYQVDMGLDEASGTLRSLAISPDGKTMITGLENAEMLLWDLPSGALLRRYAVEGGALAVAFHPHNGSVLFGTTTGILANLDLESGDILHSFTGHNEAISDIAVTTEGRHAITAAVDGTLRLWELDRGQVIRRFAAPDELAFEVDLSPDERTALSASTDGSVSLWDVGTGEMIRRFTDDQPVMAVTYAPDGKTALTGAGYRFAQKIESGHIILWDLETGEEIRRFTGQPYVVYDVEFSPDGERAVSSGNGAVVILWDVDTGQEIWRYNGYFTDNPWPVESYWDVEFSPDGRTILAGYSKGPLIQLDAQTGAEIGRFEGHVDSGATGITFTADGRRAVSSGWDTQAILWDTQMGVVLRRFTNHVGPLGQIDFSPDARLMLGGSGDGTASLWNVETGEVLRRYGDGFVMQSIFSADGRQALVGFHDGPVELWRIDTTLNELLAWTKANRYVPELTCSQREFYGVEPQCDPET